MDTKPKNPDIDLPENWQEACNLEDYARFDDFGNLTVTFMTNSFVEEDSTYGKQNVFKVLNHEGDEIKFATSSKRCMNALAGHFPIKNKTLKITRVGRDMQTQYSAENINIEA
jgi:hypothetical protein